MKRFAENIVAELRSIAKHSSINYYLDPYDGRRTCSPPNLCVTYLGASAPRARELADALGATEVKSSPGAPTKGSYLYVGSNSLARDSIRQMAYDNDGKYFGPTYGHLLKFITLHELGHQMELKPGAGGRDANGHYQDANAIMGDRFYSKYVDGRWRYYSGEEWWDQDLLDIYRWWNPPSTGVCPPSGCPGFSGGYTRVPYESGPGDMARFWTSFDAGQPQPLLGRYEYTRYTRNHVLNVYNNASAMKGDRSLLMMANDMLAEESSYAYARLFDTQVPVGSNTVLEYGISPSGALGKSVAVDLVFSDGSTLRDSPAVDQWGYRAHPGARAGHPNLVSGQWNVVRINLSQHAAGKVINKILFAYDRGPDTGDYSAWLDHIYIGEAPRAVSFTPPWSSPYQDNMAIDAPFNPGCPGVWRLSFDYAFEQGYDYGHFQRLDTNATKVFTGAGSFDTVLSGASHWAIFSDYSYTYAGFTNVTAHCY